MPSFNQIILLGNLTADVELKYTPSQTAVAEFFLASNRRWTGQDGRKKETVCFIGITAFGKLAENCSKYLKKGSAALVAGRLEYHTWEKNGEKRFYHKISADTVQFLTPLGKPNGELE